MWSKTKILSKDQFVLYFTQQLALMYQSGIPVSQSLYLLSESSLPQKYRQRLQSIQRRVEMGQSLSKSLKSYAELFPDFYRQVLHLGEKSGHLQEVLDNLANMLQKAFELKQQVRAALFYPACVLVINALMLLGMLWFVVPKYAQFFGTNLLLLPWLTQVLLRFSQNLHAHPFSLLLSGVLLVSILWLVLRQSRVRAEFVRYLVHLYFIKGFIHKRDLACLCTHVALCLKAGLPFTQALQLCKHLSIDPCWRDIFNAIEQDLCRGRSLSMSFKKHQAVPLLMLQFIKIGASTGALEQQFWQLAKIYQRELDLALQQLTRLIEPLMMLILGAAVGLIMFALYQPLIQLGSTASMVS